MNWAPIYVGRAEYSTNVIPANVMPTKQRAYVSHGGKTIEVNEFEVLCYDEGDGFRWLHGYTDGNVPQSAFEISKGLTGEPYFMGRVFMPGDLLIPGKLIPSLSSLYIPYDGKEQQKKTYQVLVLERINNA